MQLAMILHLSHQLDCEAFVCNQRASEAFANRTLRLIFVGSVIARSIGWFILAPANERDHEYRSEKLTSSMLVCLNDTSPVNRATEYGSLMTIQSIQEGRVGSLQWYLQLTS
jgi:hypothetical protein